MRKLTLLIAGFAMTMVSFHSVMAQDEEISDENLRRYALMMEVVDAMKQEISDQTNDMIKNQEGMSGKRYLELAKDGTANAKDFEKKFMQVVSDMQDERKSAISDVVQILATKMLPDGGKSYKGIKEALASDDAVKARYDKIQSTIASAGGGE